MPPVCVVVDLKFGPPLGVLGVGQPATSATVFRLLSVLPASLYVSVAFAPAIGVGHEEQSVAAVRRPDARSRKNDRPDGVAHGFQVSVNKAEPREARASTNLFPKDDVRRALADET
jgi:hypothetical protein